MSSSPSPPPNASQPRKLQRLSRPHLGRTWVIRLSLAAVLITAALLTNRSYLGWGLFVVFAILAVPLGRIRSFTLSFVPYASVWFLFTVLRSLADETMLARTLNMHVARFERWLFAGELPSIFLQDRLLDRDNLHWWDYFTTGIHWSYFIVPHAVAIQCWRKNPDLFRRFLGGMTLFLGTGLAIYFLIPSNPPWLAPEAIDSPSAPTVYRVMEDVGKQLGGGLYNASYKVVGESNPIAAMPSIHMAFTFFLIFPAFRAGRRWGLLALLYAGSMGFTLVYLGEHYVIDILVGSAVAAYGWVAAGAFTTRASAARSAPPILPAQQPSARMNA